MSLTITTREIEGVTVMDVSGRIVLGDSATEFQDAVKGLLAKGTNMILVNLEGVTRVDTTGLGALVLSRARADRQSARLKLLKVPKHVLVPLKICKLISVFEGEIYADEKDAIKSFVS